MCGIVGFFTYNLKDDKLDPRVKALVQRVLFCESLVHMQPRGKDSTGVALLWDDHETAVIKQPVDASQFAKDDGLWGEDYVNPEDKEANFRWLMETWMRKFPETKLKQAIGHVRAGTKGSEYNPHNNHPIIVSSEKVNRGGRLEGDLTIGVHNGGIKNDDTLFKQHNFSRIGEVDSEIIFHLIHQYRNDYSLDNLEKTYDELNGAFAVMAFNPANVDRVACMRETRPLNAAYIPQLGTLVLISERKYLQMAMEGFERWRIREGGSMYSYTDDQGVLQDLGEIYESFPYLTARWYDTTTNDTVESGVFTLDLSTEVTDKTDVKDLVKIKKMYKPAVAKYYTSSTTAATTTKTTDRRSTTLETTSGSVSVPTALATVEKKDESGIVDMTEYAVESSDDELADAPVEGATVTVELGDKVDEGESDEDTEHAGCPYSWEDRKAMAHEILYASAEQLADKLTLTCLSEAEVKTLLDKYLIITKDADEASTILANMYDVIFPEGFATGFAEGYESCLNDTEASSEFEDVPEDDMEKEIERLEKELESKKAAVSALNDNLSKIVSKHSKASNYISSMRPILRYFLTKEGVIGADGKINEAVLASVKYNAQQLGVALEDVTTAAMEKVIN